MDWDWHYPFLVRPDRPGTASPAASRRSTPCWTSWRGPLLPRDRPMWRFPMIDGFAPGRACAVLLMHHSIADGIGVVRQALNFLEPAYALPVPPRRKPGRLRSAAAIAVGLAQLATDGRPSGRLPTSATALRRVSLVQIPLDEVRGIARRHRARVTDVLLSAVAGGLRRAVPDPGTLPPRLRVSVTLMVRDPSSTAEGNATAAVIMDLPLGPGPELERLADIAAHSNRLRTGTRALATRFVMQTVGDLLPPPAHAWFARTVYGGRFFHAVVSNMPAPDIQLFLAGAPMREVYPMLPLAPGTPLDRGRAGLERRTLPGHRAGPGAGRRPRSVHQGGQRGLRRTGRRTGGAAHRHHLIGRPGYGEPHSRASVSRARAAGSSRAGPNSPCSWVSR